MGWGTGESTNCGLSGGRESLLIVGVADGRVTNCGGGGRESRLIVGVADVRVD